MALPCPTSLAFLSCGKRHHAPGPTVGVVSRLPVFSPAARAFTLDNTFRCVAGFAFFAVSQGYKGLFAPLLTPSVWERKGNIPAVTRLLQVIGQRRRRKMTSSIRQEAVVVQNLFAHVGFFGFWIDRSIDHVWEDHPE